MVGGGGVAACGAACNAASWDMNKAARAASGGIGAIAEEANPTLWFGRGNGAPQRCTGLRGLCMMMSKRQRAARPQQPALSMRRVQCGYNTLLAGGCC